MITEATSWTTPSFGDGIIPSHFPSHTSFSYSIRASFGLVSAKEASLSVSYHSTSLFILATQAHQPSPLPHHHATNHSFASDEISVVLSAR